MADETFDDKDDSNSNVLDILGKKDHKGLKMFKNV